MGRRKKQQEDVENEEIKPIIHGDAKRSLVAIFLFVLAVLFVLGFLADAKIVGSGWLLDFLNLVVGWMFGVGKYISPIVLIIAGIILLFRKETLFYVSKLIGLFIAFASVLGLIHILAYDADKMLEVAKLGEGGGFLGYIFAFLLLKLAGIIGGSVILIALLLMGVIVAFNFSLVTLIKKFFHKKIAQDETEKEEMEEEQQEEDLEEVLEDPIVEVEKQTDLEETEFVQDPNENEEMDSRMNNVLKKAAAWMPKGKDRAKKEQSIVDWELPPVSLLDSVIEKAQGGDVQKNAKIIQDTLKNFGIEVELGEIKTGPTVTQYSFRPAVGVKLSRITALSSDLALRLAARQVRIEAPIPGKSLVGIEVPNKANATIRLPELLSALEFENRKSNLLLALGKDVSGNYIFGDLKKMPHLLIAGSTGSGKSVCVNTLLLSMLYQNSPEELKLILVDPKRVELTPYNGIPHLLTDVIVENGKVLSALKWAIGEMERRYKLLQSVGSKDIASFNKKSESGEMLKKVNTETGEITEEAFDKIPFIVIVIDELADLMASHGKEVEGAIIRLAQMARAVGIHLILSTQKPIVTVITSLIKSNIPTRVAFRVPSLMDSRTILDASGAEKLLGNGDMLFSAAEAVDLRRVQGVFVSEEEVKRVVDFIKKQKFEKIEDDLEDEIVSTETKPEGNRNGEAKTVQYADKIDFDSIEADENEDSLYDEAKKIVIQSGKASSSLLQRRLRIGYSRAARLIDILEERGIVGEADGAKPREILVAAGQPEYEDSMTDQVARDKWQM
ncbi:MAG: translocase FtsK protein [Candidatus Moranbacteria bacterium GW2011_GWC2_37_73]|nr:MAG: translocase FtsK protein [Parcubacteria group bacterium GW2011_GWC1_36_108]KKQ00420.1 MAG: translocase FtsK protein [Candidatus Moranbacteria bacterium GW2011_GWD1_36_198]KKQ01624.1 MAG: translocase FtsK protein [Candidatus Moranbacteria bacterium GW2011_GWD2_36_198]KKQ40362.1 MAG: translocase FtsK protein [Candidatus Moranbacteria bacterium GW2011_GWC2_37_73]HBI50856.1 cell division protein FtsK [Candidatus Moranbacteria bacterium]